MPSEVFDKLPAETQEQISAARARQLEVTERFVTKLAKDAATPNPSKEAGGPESSTALAVHGTAWPEGEETRQALQEWCFNEGVPPPQEPREGHREKVSDEMPLTFGLVTRPVAPNSAEWNSERGQHAIAEEMSNHTRRGTWDLSRVRELDDVVQEAWNTSEDVIYGGVHPILGAKGAERGTTEYRCRVVFTAPRAPTASGLDARVVRRDQLIPDHIPSFPDLARVWCDERLRDIHA